MTHEEERANRAQQYLADTAEAIGLAKANRDRADAALKRIKALAMVASDAKAIAAQERDAYASDLYAAGIDDLWESTKAYETLRAKRDAASAAIEYWRTFSVNHRLMRV